MTNILHNGVYYPGATVEKLVSVGVPQAVIGAALKEDVIAEITKMADIYRDNLSQASAGKIAVYQVKARIAADPANASAAALAAIDVEAAARGLDRDGLFALVISKAQAFETVAMSIEAQEAQAKAAIAALPDDANDIEDQIAAALSAAKTTADTAFAEAQAVLNGG